MLSADAQPAGSPCSSRGRQLFIRAAASSVEDAGLGPNADPAPLMPNTTASTPVYCTGTCSTQSLKPPAPNLATMSPNSSRLFDLDHALGGSDQQRHEQHVQPPQQQQQQLKLHHHLQRKRHHAQHQHLAQVWVPLDCHPALCVAQGTLLPPEPDQQQQQERPWHDLIQPAAFSVDQGTLLPPELDQQQQQEQGPWHEPLNSWDLPLLPDDFVPPVSCWVTTCDPAPQQDSLPSPDMLNLMRLLPLDLNGTADGLMQRVALGGASRVAGGEGGFWGEFDMRELEEDGVQRQALGGRCGASDPVGDAAAAADVMLALHNGGLMDGQADPNPIAAFVNPNHHYKQWQLQHALDQSSQPQQHAVAFPGRQQHHQQVYDLPGAAGGQVGPDRPAGGQPQHENCSMAGTAAASATAAAPDMPKHTPKGNHIFSFEAAREFRPPTQHSHDHQQQHLHYQERTSFFSTVTGVVPGSSYVAGTLPTLLGHRSSTCSGNVQQLLPWPAAAATASGDSPPLMCGSTVLQRRERFVGNTFGSCSMAAGQQQHHGCHYCRQDGCLQQQRLGLQYSSYCSDQCSDWGRVGESRYNAGSSMDVAAAGPDGGAADVPGGRFSCSWASAAHSACALGASSGCGDSRYSLGPQHAADAAAAATGQSDHQRLPASIPVAPPSECLSSCCCGNLSSACCLLVQSMSTRASTRSTMMGCSTRAGCSTTAPLMMAPLHCKHHGPAALSSQSTLLSPPTWPVPPSLTRQPLFPCHPPPTANGPEGNFCTSMVPRTMPDAVNRGTGGSGGWAQATGCSSTNQYRQYELTRTGRLKVKFGLVSSVRRTKGITGQRGAGALDVWVGGGEHKRKATHSTSDVVQGRARARMRPAT